MRIFGRAMRRLTMTQFTRATRSLLYLSALPGMLRAQESSEKKEANA